MPKQGALVCGGTGNFLVAGKAVGAGDFQVRARLSLERLDGAAASLMIGGNHFGFDGHGKKFFVEGPAFGRTRLLGDAGKVIVPGKPFDVEVARKGTTLSFHIDGKEIHSAPYRLAPVCAIGFRPWRATMRLYDFSVSGNLTPVTEAAIKTMQQDPKKTNHSSTKSVNAITVGGVKIDLSSPPAGLGLHRDLGILAATAIQGKIIHRSNYVWVPRATITPEGDYLILFPEGKGRYYQGEKMLAYRSSDKGKSWTGPTLAFDSSQSHHGFVPLIPRGSKRIYAFGTQPLPGMVGDRSKGLQENCPIGFRYSDDDGHTWSERREVTESVKDPSWGWYATGPGVGIQIEKGPFKGRLVIPSDHRVGNMGSHMMYSDDHGLTWHYSERILPGCNECQVVELIDGRLMNNARTYGIEPDYRGISTSTDGGVTWSDVWFDHELPEPTCQASFLRYTRSDSEDKNRLLFSNPAHTSSRVNMTIKMSYDEGQSWPVARRIYEGSSAYSCLVVMPDWTIGCFSEKDGYGKITLARFSLEWLTNGADKMQKCTFALRGDINSDCIVNMEDFAVIAAEWLQCNLVPRKACPWENEASILSLRLGDNAR